MLLKLGMEGPDVLNLEQALLGLGFSGFDADGVFDEKTENVVKYIQRSHNLLQDGIAGPKTLDVIDSLYQPLIRNFETAHASTKEELQVLMVHGFSGILASVNPILARKAQMIVDLAAREGYKLIVTQGLRTFAEQNNLFAKKPKVTNARGGMSYHNYGLAVDFAFVKDGKAVWEDKLYKNIGRWASRVGLEWGGNWHFVDTPHVQLANLPSIRKLLAIYNKTQNEKVAVKEVWSTFVK